MRRRVVITGMGCVSPLGHSVAATWSRLLRGDTGMIPTRDAPHFFPPHFADAAARAAVLDALPAKVVASVPVVDNFLAADIAVTAASNCNTRLSESSAAAASSSPSPSSSPARPVVDAFAPTSRVTRHQLFAEHAAAEALVASGLLLPASAAGGAEGKGAADKQRLALFDETCTRSGYAADVRGVNVGIGMNSLHDIADAAHYVYSAAPRLNKVEPFFVPKILCNTVSGALAMRYLLRGPNHATSTACATGAHCIGDAFRWIQHGDADMAVVGAAEAATTPLGLAGFSRMKALCVKHGDAPAQASRPFDADRSGFVMGEGAGVLVLEELGAARARGAHILAEIVGYGLSGDAFHVSSPHPDGVGAALAMRRALLDSARSDETAVSAADVAYLNAHATGTPMGDEIELAAATRVLRPACEHGGSGGRGLVAPLIVSSIKGNIGHLLGAAGAVEAIVAVEALRGSVAPATANLTKCIVHDEARVRLPGPRDGPVPLASPVPGRPLVVMSTSFGFGGTNAALLLRAFG